MARKTLEDFNNDYWAYANYLQSAECANDEGYDTYVDVPSGNIYESDDWTKGHGHRNVFAKNWKGRDKDDPESQGRPWEKMVLYAAIIKIIFFAITSYRSFSL